MIKYFGGNVWWEETTWSIWEDKMKKPINHPETEFILLNASLFSFYLTGNKLRLRYKD
jgi:hypothetical protein